MRHPYFSNQPDADVATCGIAVVEAQIAALQETLEKLRAKEAAEKVAADKIDRDRAWLGDCVVKDGPVPSRLAKAIENYLESIPYARGVRRFVDGRESGWEVSDLRRQGTARIPLATAANMTLIELEEGIHSALAAPGYHVLKANG